MKSTAVHGNATKVEQLRANDESSAEFLMYDEAAARKYVSTLVKIMKTTTSDARAQYFAVSRYAPTAFADK